VRVKRSRESDGSIVTYFRTKRKTETDKERGSGEKKGTADNSRNAFRETKDGREGKNAHEQDPGGGRHKPYSQFAGICSRR